MTELQQLVMRYRRDEIGYADFRCAFVPRFATRESADSDLQKAIDGIESACCDFSEGMVQEDQLKRKLAALSAVRDERW